MRHDSLLLRASTVADVRLIAETLSENMLKRTCEAGFGTDMKRLLANPEAKEQWVDMCILAACLRSDKLKEDIR